MTENRSTTLLKAVLEILYKCDDGPRNVKEFFGETAFYDGAECDGYCLMDDIKNYLEYGE